MMADLAGPGGGQREGRPPLDPAHFATVERGKGWGDWMPFAQVRLSDRKEYARPDFVTFEFRLSRVCETVAGPRGMWWDELVRLLLERMEFIAELGQRQKCPELVIKLDAISTERLWSAPEF